MLQDASILRPLARQVAKYERLARDESFSIRRAEQVLVSIRSLVERLNESDWRRQLLTWCSSESERIQGLRGELRFKLGTELKSSLEAQGFGVSGQLPLLRVGHYTLRVDFEGEFAHIFWGPEVELLRARVPLVASEIARNVATLEQELRRHPLVAEEFLERLRSAYGRHLRESGKPPGAKVYLTDVLREMVFLMQSRKFAANPVRANFRGYSRVQFSYDLYRLRQLRTRTDASEQYAGPALRLSVATFDSTTDKVKSLWIPDSDEGTGTYYSFIAFEEKID
ncbi:MAG: hypothetical protein ABIK62_03685 [candidate division WOR-3 bacterium]